MKYTILDVHGFPGIYGNVEGAFETEASDPIEAVKQYLKTKLNNSYPFNLDGVAPDTIEINGVDYVKKSAYDGHIPNNNYASHSDLRIV